MIGPILTAGLAGIALYRANLLADKVSNAPNQLVNFVGANFSELALENPLLGFLFKLTVTITIGFISLLLLSRWAKFKLPRAVEKAIIITPFVLVASMGAYMARVQYLKVNDPIYGVFKNATTPDEVVVARVSAKLSHAKEQAKDPMYIYRCIGSNYSRAFYEDLVRDLNSTDLIAARKKVDVGASPFGFGAKEKQQLTPLMYAALTGNSSAVEALCADERVKINDALVTKKTDYCSFWSSKKWEKTREEYAFDLAKRGGYKKCMDAISKKGNERDVVYFSTYSSNKKQVCK